MVIGLNQRAAPLAMRERFWITENRRYEVLRQLNHAEGVEEAMVLSTCCRIEFLVWASEPTLAANSVLQYLRAEHGLKLSEWEHFYRLLDESALIHVFRVTSGLDSLILGEPEIVSHVEEAWERARTVGASGRFLDAVLEKALAVAKRVREETAVGKLAVSTPAAALELARRIFGSLEGRKILLLGAGKVSELSARQMVESGAGSVVVMDQSLARSEELAKIFQGTAAPLSDRWKQMLQADIAICASGCPHALLTREEAERIAGERNRVALVVIDIGMPRNVDPEVRRVDGILLCDMDGLERIIASKTPEKSAAAAEAEQLVAAEAQGFSGALKKETTVPTVVALHRRLEQICRQELESFIQGHGPLHREQVQLLHSLTEQVIRKIAGSLARELKDVPEKGEQERMAAAVTRLFHLDSPNTALAGAISESGKAGPTLQRAVGLNR